MNSAPAKIGRAANRADANLIRTGDCLATQSTRQDRKLDRAEPRGHLDRGRLAADLGPQLRHQRGTNRAQVAADLLPRQGKPGHFRPGVQGDEPVRRRAADDGAQAEVYADHFIANHLKAIGGGKTYAQLSAEAQANPTDTKLAATVETMFKGETLRGLLLNAYAFGTMGFIAGIGAVAAFVAAGLMLILGGLGLIHSRRTPPAEEVFGAPVQRTPASVG